jgi:three-Cys-motif partner protein
MKEPSIRKFGGDWSDAKLDALRRYIASYSQALSKTTFERIYIDAFAGAGIVESEITESEQGLFEENLATEEASYRHGSPLIALEADPGFHRFIFIERNAQSIAQLRE